ncbi:MAG: hypothetical protein NTW21_24295 [Verrucomicrobia bacterium]|nr:hypothetical protein [Verrucomicrobiota bacterium]
MSGPIIISEKPFPAVLEPLGFSPRRSGGHMARSMMLAELTTLIGLLPANAPLSDYQQAIEADNALGKPTFSSRRNSFRHLIDLYGLDPGLALFRGLRLFCAADPASLPLVALVCSFCRDPQLRHSFTLIDSLRAGEVLPRVTMEQHLDAGFPDRFSDAMKKSLAQNVNTTWTAAGHLVGRTVKRRAMPKPTLASSVYAMFAGWLAGLRGDFLLHSVFGRLAAAEPAQIIAHLASGSGRGWLRLRSAGGITEIDFSPILTDRETQLLHVTH